MEGGFFCLHKLEQNICEKNNPSPSPLLVKSLRCRCNSKCQCKLCLRKSLWGPYCFPARCLILGTSLWQGSAQGKHQLPTERDSGKLGPIPHRAALPRAGGQPRGVCRASLSLSRSFISFGLLKLPPHRARCPGLSLASLREQSGARPDRTFGLK